MSFSPFFSFLNAMGGSPLELAVVLVAILLLFGADALPSALRTLGRWTEQLRRISLDLQREIQDAEEPFRQAQRDWEEETRDLRVTGPDPGRRAGKPDPDAPEPPAEADAPRETNNED
jgi:Sec-independent protein translocase protein TatA